MRASYSDAKRRETIRPCLGSPLVVTFALLGRIAGVPDDLLHPREALRVNQRNQISQIASTRTTIAAGVR